MSLPAAITKRIAQGTKTVLYIFLLTFYVGGASQSQLLHQLFHSHDHSVSHSEAQEQDPCHRSIYHNDEEKGCEHHSHIVVADNCELCDLTFHTDQILLSEVESPSILFFPVDFATCSRGFAGSSQSILSSRAPPVA
jgi:hypothetical protein